MSRDLVYLVDDATLRANPAQAGCQAHTAPDNPSLWIVAVSNWYSPQDQHRWEALPGVTCLHPEDHGQPAPPALLAAFASWGVRPGHSRREALTAIRAVWGMRI